MPQRGADLLKDDDAGHDGIAGKMADETGMVLANDAMVIHVPRISTRRATEEQLCEAISAAHLQPALPETSHERNDVTGRDAAAFSFRTSPTSGTPSYQQCTTASKLLSSSQLVLVKRLLAILLLTAALFVYWRLHRPLEYPPGVLIPSDPVQVAAPPRAAAISYGSFRLQPLAHFEADARLLHAKSYRWDRQAALVPVDLAVGWGAMSDQQVLDHLRISQSMRFYWYEYHQPPPIPPQEIVSHSTNIHIIPATSDLASRSRHLRVGSLLHLSGELVEATGPNIRTWRSSLSRTDTGNGACELLYLTKLELLDRP